VSETSDEGETSGEPRDAPSCGEPFYLSFVRYEEGREIDPRAESELVEIDPDPRPSGPRGPSGPPGPDGAEAAQAAASGRIGSENWLQLSASVSRAIRQNQP